jgi:hypothetical protein
MLTKPLPHALAFTPQQIEHIEEGCLTSRHFCEKWDIRSGKHSLAQECPTEIYAALFAYRSGSLSKDSLHASEQK